MSPTRLPAVHPASGVPDEWLRQALRDGTWVRVLRGAYARPADVDAPRDLHLARALAVHRRMRSAHAFSHETAALLWELPLWRVPSDVHLRHAVRQGPRTDPSVTRHHGLPSPSETTRRLGLPVTSLALTVVDCARTLRPLDALVVADAALAAGLVRADALALVDEVGRGRGSARARAVVGLADAGAQSPGESATRWVVLRAGLPAPETQVRVTTRLGTFWADLGWTDARLLLEYDGRVKYADPEVLVAEKRRHDAIVEAGWTVLRVTKEDLRDGAALVRRVLARMPVPLRPRGHLAHPHPRRASS
ncbi:hypothetical protein [Cellulomonas massiliensis]|uniref:hypothetical protein n=1 Tax=Cellulomonas massiliensis TaxID=1465811 RepID=UPI0002DA3205|nr:hypothetical protein [Cellulomonas massiliensis]